MNFNFVWFHTRSYGSRLHGKLFWFQNDPVILIGFYRGGVYLWNPLTNRTIAMKFYRFKKEQKKKTLL